MRMRGTAAMAVLGVLLAGGTFRGAGPVWDDEFIGPFPSWANARTDYGARGDGVTDDSVALQHALDDLGAPGHSPVLYLPAGTYRVSSTLRLTSRIHVSIIGAGPTTTSLRWAGPRGGVLIQFTGMAYSRVNRLTFDGASRAGVLVDQAWDCQHNYFDTANEYADNVFKNAAIGIRGGNNDCGFAETSVWRSRFSGLTTAGIALKNFNALDLWVWYSRFENCAVGVTNDPGAGNFHVYNSVFRGSTVSDLYIKNTGGFNIRNNTSIGSKAFWTTASPFRYPAALTLQGNAVSTSSATPILIGNQGPAFIVDNVVNSARSAPPIAVGFSDPSPDGDALLVGNRFSSATPSVVKGRSLAFDNVVGASARVTEPALPPTPPRRARLVFEVAPGSGSAVIQQAINNAWQAGSRAVVHLPYGEYPVDTTLVVPANGDIQIIGDGEMSVLRRAGAAGPVLRLAGPTRAVLRDFRVSGESLGDAIAIEQADQPGSRLYLNQTNLSGSVQANLLLDGLDYLVADLRDFEHGVTPGGSLTVVGGPLAGAGVPRTAKVNVFSGASCCNTGSAYVLSNGGSLMVRDIWYENHGASAPYLRAAGSGVLTVAGVRVAHPTSAPAFDFNGFRGGATLLSSLVDAPIVVHGPATGSRLFGDGLVMAAGVSGYLDDTSSPAGAVAFRRTRMMVPGGSSSPLPDVGSLTTQWVRQMLAQTRAEQPQVVGALPASVTDVRMYRVAAGGAVVGLRVTP